MGFSNKIKKFFNDKGLTNREVGKIMDNYSEVSVGRHVNSDKISATFINKLIKYFPDADIDYLVKNNNYDERTAKQVIREIEDRLDELKTIIQKQGIK